MSVRKVVEEFVRKGVLPDSSASEETIATRQRLLERINRPISDAEAEMLARCFGPDDCFGLAWALLHLIETAPGGCPIKSQPGEWENEWVRLLWDRSHRE
jgi:hypothetical protein